MSSWPSASTVTSARAVKRPTRAMRPSRTNRLPPSITGAPAAGQTRAFRMSNSFFMVVYLLEPPFFIHYGILV